LRIVSLQHRNVPPNIGVAATTDKDLIDGISASDPFLKQ
jgi:hypothetical protein